MAVDDVEEHGVGAERVEDADGGAERAVALAFLGNDGAPRVPAAARFLRINLDVEPGWRNFFGFVLFGDPKAVNLRPSLVVFPILLLPNTVLVLVLILVLVLVLLLDRLRGLPEHLDDHGELRDQIPELIPS